MADKIHCVKKTLRLTPAESRLLSEKAEAFHMNEAEYLRLLISQTPNDYPEIRQELKQLINEVNHIGVNINQIVHHQNYELYSKEDRQQLIAYMKKSIRTNFPFLKGKYDMIRLPFICFVELFLCFLHLLKGIIHLTVYG